jgi:DNA-binding beta-propeller fold protein YncE
MSYSAFSLDHLASGGGTTAVFRAGLTAQSHQWDIKAQSGSLLAYTVRVHRGGKFAQAFWKFWNVIGMGAGDDIHVELFGAEGILLARATTGNWPAIVTVTDATGRQVVRSKRKKDTVTVYGRDDQLVATLQREGDSPWPLRTEAGDVLGEILAGKPGPESPALWEWAVWPDFALDSAAYNKNMHLGLRRVMQYSFAPTGYAGPDAVALAMLPLVCGLTY